MTNVSILIGRWTRENSYTEGNTTIFKNTIAVDHPFKKDDSSFIQVTMFGKSAELANQYTGKGSQIAIEGHIQTGRYENKEGVTVYTTEVIGNRITFLDSKGGGGQSNSAQQSGNTNTPNTQQGSQNQPQGTQGMNQGQADVFANQVGATGGPIEVSDDDLPF